MNNIPSHVFLYAKDYQTITTSGWQGALHFRRYGRELVSKPAISKTKRRGGYRSKIIPWPKPRRREENTEVSGGHENDVMILDIMVHPGNSPEFRFEDAMFV